jgi:hypothetical protein
MAIDQSKLGQLVSEQMQAIEDDPEVSEFAQIGDIVCIVEIIDPGREVLEGEEFEVKQGIRYRHSGLPHVALGLTTYAKAVMTKSMTG